MNYVIHPAPAPYNCAEADGVTKLLWSYKEDALATVYDVVDVLVTDRTKTISDSGTLDTTDGTMALFAEFWIVGCARTVTLAISGSGDSFATSVSGEVNVYNEDGDNYYYDDTDTSASISESIDIIYDGACPLRVTIDLLLTLGHDSSPIAFSGSLSFTITP